MNENYYETAKALNLTLQQIQQLAINGFEASWLSESSKKKHIGDVIEYFKSLELQGE